MMVPQKAVRDLEDEIQRLRREHREEAASLQVPCPHFLLDYHFFFLGVPRVGVSLLFVVAVVLCRYSFVLCAAVLLL